PPDGACGMCGREADAAALVEGSVTPPGASHSRSSDDPVRVSAADSHPVPISRSCFACGIDNGLGLRAQLRHDSAAVGETWRPTASHQVAGSLAPVALTTLLDQAP